MAAKHPVALVFGAGSNIGNAVVKKFASKGYKVALVARSLSANDSTADQLNIPSDLSKTEEVEGIFLKVKEKLGTPSVVVYNCKLSRHHCSYQIAKPSQRVLVPSHPPTTLSPSHWTTSSVMQPSTSPALLLLPNRP